MENKISGIKDNIKETIKGRIEDTFGIETGLSGRKKDIAGCVKEQGIVYWGADIASAVKRGETECAAWCYQKNNCDYWTLKESDNMCFLKSSNADRREMSQRISGSKLCGAISGGILYTLYIQYYKFNS